MPDRLDTVERLLKLATATLALPGAGAVILYAIHNDFFPFMIATLPIVQIMFISVVVLLILVFGVALGIASCLWLIWLIVKFRAIKRHVFIPPDRPTRLFFVAVSFPVFCSLLTGCLLAASRGDSQPIKLFCYFVVSGFLVSAVLAPADGDTSSLRKLVPLAAVVPLVALSILPWTVIPQLNLYMTLMGLRSDPREQVYVGDPAYGRIEAQTAFYIGGAIACRVTIGDRPMWRLDRGVVVWNAGGNEVLLTAGVQEMRPFSVEQDQVMVLPGRGAPTC